MGELEIMINLRFYYSYMVTMLDDEYVLQMDDNPPFSWLSKSHERIMSCSFNLKERTIVHAKGNALTYSIIAKSISERNMEIDESFERMEEGFHIVISTGGDEQNSINFIKEIKGKCSVISSGGQIKKIAREKGFEFISLPKGMPSRFIFPEIVGCISGRTNIENIEYLRDRILNLSPSSLTEGNIAKYTAIELDRRKPIIVYDAKLYAFARKLFEDMLQNSGIISPMMSTDQKDMIDSLSDDYAVIEISRPKKQSVKGSQLIEIGSKMDDVIYSLTLMSYISLYSSLLNGKDFFLFDRLKE